MGLNLVESVMHKGILFILVGILTISGLLLFNLGPQDDPVWVGISLGLNMLVIYIILYVLTKAFFWGGSKVNL